MIVYLARDIRPFVMYCINGKPRSSLLIESTDSMIGALKNNLAVHTIRDIYEHGSVTALALASNSDC